MNLDFSVLRPTFNHMALELAAILGTMLACGLVIVLITRLLFFWLPGKARGQISSSVGVLGAFLGLWVAFKLFFQ